MRGGNLTWYDGFWLMMEDVYGISGVECISGVELDMIPTRGMVSRE